MKTKQPKHPTQPTIRQYGETAKTRMKSPALPLGKEPQPPTKAAPLKRGKP
jgi:hypothetical protein